MGSLPPSDAAATTTNPWIKTPCIFSPELSRIAGCNIYLKLDNLQPSGSFKSRGIGNMMTKAIASAPGDDIRFYCTSGGNGGLACATSALSLQRPVTIALPTIAPAVMRQKLELLGAQVHVMGDNFAEANRRLHEDLLAKDPTGVYVHPYDHPDVWAGHASIVDELRQQLHGRHMDAIVCAVGGGGLVNGIMEGVVNHGAGQGGKETIVLAVETVGADSLNASVLAGEHVTLPGITSIAFSLGASQVSERTWQWARDRPDILKSVVVPDADAALSCVRFADDARLLVEVSCGAALAPVYRGDLKSMLGFDGLSDASWAEKNVVLEVCGGSGVSLDVLASYRKVYGGQGSVKV